MSNPPADSTVGFLAGFLAVCVASSHHKANSSNTSLLCPVRIWLDSGTVICSSGIFLVLGLSSTVQLHRRSLARYFFLRSIATALKSLIRTHMSTTSIKRVWVLELEYQPTRSPILPPNQTSPYDLPSRSPGNTIHPVHSLIGDIGYAFPLRSLPLSNSIELIDTDTSTWLSDDFAISTSSAESE
ncbi:hypothetical protein C8R45DRAFT_1098959 [Mycena sanguinolenta]|nr:hypothetical protein C8R45DRAFT_1098959 [Mycena sanguinolenta]